MREAETQSSEARPEGQAVSAVEAGETRPFTLPKLTFVRPKLVREGGMTEVTAGFFGTFSP